VLKDTHFFLLSNIPHHRVETLRYHIVSSIYNNHHRVKTLRYHIGRPAGTHQRTSSSASGMTHI